MIIIIYDQVTWGTTLRSITSRTIIENQTVLLYMIMILEHKWMVAPLDVDIDIDSGSQGFGPNSE